VEHLTAPGRVAGRPDQGFADELFGAFERLEGEEGQASPATRLAVRPYRRKLFAEARVILERLQAGEISVSEAEVALSSISVLVLQLALKLHDLRCPPGALRRNLAAERERSRHAGRRRSANRCHIRPRGPRARRSHARRRSTRARTRTRAPAGSGSSEPPGELDARARGARRPLRSRAGRRRA
jgi:hypothetical protein